ncbi:MAG: hypothetical protein Q4E70_02145 [Candidatus Saccharibacteria bacterium]|nr:hypothetical protein [Candidatus Saccharibacteria bacterium]
MKKFKVFLLALVAAFVAINPATVQAAPAPNIQSWVWNYNQCQNANLSEGTIYWDDDLVTGQIDVWEIYNYGNNNNRQFQIQMTEYYNISDNAKTKKQIAKKQAQNAFLPVRVSAQNKGWWDVDWRFVTVKKNKVAAEATVEYKSVRTGVNSKLVYIRQITKKKHGRWETMFFVGDRSYTPSQIASVFN